MLRFKERRARAERSGEVRCDDNQSPISVFTFERKFTHGPSDRRTFGPSDRSFLCHNDANFRRACRVSDREVVMAKKTARSTRKAGRAKGKAAKRTAKKKAAPKKKAAAKKV